MKLKIFCRCSLFPSWSGYGLISTLVFRVHSEVVTRVFFVTYLIFQALILCKLEKIKSVVVHAKKV